MKMMTNDKLSILKGGKLYSIEMSDPRFEEAEKLYHEDSIEEFIQLVVDSYEESVFKSENIEGFEVSETEISYKGRKIEGILKEKLKNLLKKNLSILPFSKFLDNLYKNPSSNSIKQLYDFLSYKDLPIDEEGYIIAYKGVNYDYYSSHGNTRTKVLQGVVDEAGRILNTPGSKIAVERSDVDDDFNNHCSFGLHVGSYDYASGFASRVVMVRVNPADAVSVPRDCSFQKLRCCAYEVICDFESEIQAPLVEVKDSTLIEHDRDDDYEDFRNSKEREIEIVDFIESELSDILVNEKINKIFFYEFSEYDFYDELVDFIVELNPLGLAEDESYTPLEIESVIANLMRKHSTFPLQGDMVILN